MNEEIYDDEFEKETMLDQKKVYGFWSSFGFKIGAVMHFYFILFCFKAILFVFANREIRDTLYMQGPNFPCTKYSAAKRGFTNQANIYTPVRIPIDPAILSAIGLRFIAKKQLCCYF